MTTDDELIRARDDLLGTLMLAVNYWARPDTAPDYTLKMRLEGLVFSVLCALDGVDDCTGFVLVPERLADGIEGIHQGEYLHDLWAKQEAQ